MTADGVMPPPEDQLVCACGKAIQPCPATLGPLFVTFCRGYVHKATLEHNCRSREGLAEPRGASVPP